MNPPPNQQFAPRPGMQQQQPGMQQPNQQQQQQRPGLAQPPNPNQQQFNQQQPGVQQQQQAGMQPRPMAPPGSGQPGSFSGPPRPMTAGAPRPMATGPPRSMAAGPPRPMAQSGNFQPRPNGVPSTGQPPRPTPPPGAGNFAPRPMASSGGPPRPMMASGGGNFQQQQQQQQHPRPSGMPGPPGRGPPPPVQNGGVQHMSRGGGPPPPMQGGRGPPQMNQQHQQQQHQQGARPPPMNQQHPQQPQQPAARPHTKSRINPEQIPRPKVNNKLTKYETASGGPVPSVLDEFVVVDDGSASPRFMRMTINTVPDNAELLKMSRVPLACVMQPFAELGPNEQAIPRIDNGEDGPARCEQCRGYINAFVTFKSSNTEWECNLCGSTNKASTTLAGNVSMYGGGLPPELSHGSVDFVVRNAYMVRPPQKDLTVFVVDMTALAVASGMTTVVIDALEATIEGLVHTRPGASVGLVAFDSSIYYYDTRSTDAMPQILIVNDLDDAFAPLPASCWLLPVAPDQDEGRIGRILELMREQVGDKQKEVAHLEQAHNQQQQQAQQSTQSQLQHAHESCLGACLHSVAQGLQHAGGNVCAFFASLPMLGQGKLTDRENVSKYGTSSEHDMYTSCRSDQTYARLAKRCAETYISVDLFPMTAASVDLGTLIQLPNCTGGNVHMFRELGPGASSAPAVQRVANTRFRLALARVLLRPAGLEAVLKVRCSKGLRVVEYIGLGTKRIKGGELDAASMDADQSSAVILTQEGSTGDSGVVYVQCAVLHTTQDGVRAVRVHTKQMQTTNAVWDVYRTADVHAVANILARVAGRDLYNEDRQSYVKSLEEVRKEMTIACVAMLHAYRVHCARDSNIDQLILPEGLKLLPLYVMSLMKTDMLRVNGAANRSSSRQEMDVRADERAAACLAALSWPIRKLIRFSHPDLYQIPVTSQESDAPIRRHPTAESLSLDGLFLLDDGIDIVVFVGQQLSPPYKDQIVRAVQGSNELVFAPTSDDLATRVVGFCQSLRPTLPVNTVVASVRVAALRGPHERAFLNKLVEDQLVHEVSYISFLVSVHGKIRDQLVNGA